MKHFTFTRTLGVAAAALLAIPSPSMAEDKPDGGLPHRPRGAGGPRGERHMGPEARLRMMTGKLGLTEEQQAKIRAIHEKNRPQFKEFMAKGRENLTEDDRTKLRELMKSQRQEVGAVLTPEQREKMKEARRQHAGVHGDRKPGGPAGGRRGDHMGETEPKAGAGPASS